MRNTETAERMKMTGVYAITHLASGKRYVGSAAKAFVLRLATHRCDLLKGRHHSIHLQRAWIKYGADAFEFRILRVTPPEEAVGFEQAFIDLYKACDRACGYNISPIAGSALGTTRSPECRAKQAELQRGKKHSAESREKMSTASRGRKHSPESRAKMSEIQRELKSCPEYRAKLSARLRGIKRSPEACAQMSASRRGRKPSQETRDKMSATRRGKRPSEATKAKRNAIYSDPAFLLVHRARMKARNSAPQARLANSEGLKRLYSDPEKKAVIMAKKAATILRHKLSRASALLRIISNDPAALFDVE